MPSQDSRSEGDRREGALEAQTQLESDVRFRRLVEQAPIAMAVIGLDGVIGFINRRAVEVFGYLPQDIPNMDRWWEQAYPSEQYREDVVRIWTSLVEKALAEDRDIEGREYEVTCKNGTCKMMYISGVPVAKQILVTFEDITARKRAELELRASEERYRFLVETTNTGYVIIDANGVVLDANLEYVRLTGHESLAQICGRSVLEWTAADQRSHNAQAVDQCAKNGFIRDLELAYVDREGKRTLVEVNATVMQGDGTQRILSLCRDITQRKQAENLLAIQHRLAQGLISATDSIEWLRLCLTSAFEASQMDCGGIYLMSRTDGCLKLVVHQGLSAEFVAASRHFGSDSPQTKLAMTGGSVYTEHLHLGMPVDDHRQREKLRAIAVIPVKYEDRVIGCLNIASHDHDNVPPYARRALETIAAQVGAGIAQLRAEEALRQSNERFSKVFRSSPDAISISRLSDGVFLDINPSFSLVTGYTPEEILGRSALPGDAGLWVNHSDRDRMVDELTKKGRVVGMEASMRAKDGAIRIVMLSARLVEFNNERCVLLIVRDVTERKRMEEELQKTQRLEALGVLAGGIAHDFNNLLSGIFGHVDLARSVSTDPDVIDCLDATLATMDRAKALTMQLLTFARGGAPVQKVTPIAAFVREVVQFALSGSKVACQFNTEGDIWSCNIDKNQIGQVIDNIVINAQQAMPNGGTIQVSLENVTIGADEMAALTQGNYVRLSIQDQGFGIPKSILPRIFDPFFTTKARGHGLGLATSYSIVHRHGGQIDAESELGKGTVFHVYLPAVEGNSETKRPKATEHRGRGRIIVVDDEEIVRNTLGRMLIALGYSPVCMGDAREAIECLRTASNTDPPVVAILLDLTAPGGMGGVEAASELRRLSPDIPVFVTSGYADDRVMLSPGDFGLTASISKPLTIADLSKMLSEHLVAN